MHVESEEFLSQAPIRLVDPQEPLMPDGEGFRSKYTPIGDLGRAFLYGSRAFEYDRKLAGVAVAKNRVQFGRAYKIAEDPELFDTDVRLEGCPPIGRVNIHLQIPKYELQLFGGAEIEEEEIEDDLEKKYYALNPIWRLAGKGKNIILFAPADSKVLSLMEFRFGYSGSIVVPKLS